ncbi:decaprenyl-phosphate phosphoribosyltransferase [Raineyella antarctica]|uniref:Decaprenyl-phosphate phosphoribosyltransferase n=1 Tax=Raineyella antarctica TaxID=1577474 RepID=A0A1G6H6P2_9ACTN|nr:decaprenyl-phosphate phosphoribosyltransferase [Raineyella antarctica]SDB89136.1 decaprenyl-phosphate phosphoribosyltransferase [Raineyella antarctica]
MSTTSDAGTTASPLAPDSRPRTFLPAWLRAMRPKQWVKNILVLTAPLAAGRIFEGGVIVATLLAMVAFIAVSSAIYLLNDIHDIEADRQHPKKRFRPIPAGELPIWLAWLLALVAAGGGLALGFWVSVPLGITLASYMAIQFLYSYLLKDFPVVDLAVVASGFLLRAVAGGVATGIPLSQWFLLVASFGSLFMVAGKRYSEIRHLGPEAGTRKSLASYTESYLKFVWELGAVAVVMSYSLWAFEQRVAGGGRALWAAISIFPFTLAMLQYAFRIDRGEGGAPEDVVLHDRALLVLGLTWLVTIGLAVFL